MMTIYIGLPASGKSTFAAHYVEKHPDTVICSSDAVRKELYGDEADQTDPSKVFEVLRKQIKDNLKQHKNVIADATNLSYKRRMGLVKEMKKLAGRVDARLFVVPINSCIHNNKNRDRQVPAWVIREKYPKQFWVPGYFEGYDEIHISWSHFPSYLPDPDSEEIMEFDQHNHHHAYTLGQHQKNVEDSIKKMLADGIRTKHPDELLEAARYHDMGKAYTQFFRTNPDGTKEAHYYSHQNMSAYLYLNYVNDRLIADHNFKIPKAEKDKILYTASLINWHMRPYDWNRNPDCRDKDDALLGEDFTSDLDIFSWADDDAKGVEEEENENE